MSNVKPTAAKNARKTTLNQTDICSHSKRVHADLLALESKTSFHVINNNLFLVKPYLEYLERNP